MGSSPFLFLIEMEQQLKGALMAPTVAFVVPNILQDMGKNKGECVFKEINYIYWLFLKLDIIK